MLFTFSRFSLTFAITKEEEQKWKMISNPDCSLIWLLLYKKAKHTEEFRLDTQSVVQKSQNEMQWMEKKHNHYFFLMMECFKWDWIATSIFQPLNFW